MWGDVAKRQRGPGPKGSRRSGWGREPPAARNLSRYKPPRRTSLESKELAIRLARALDAKKAVNVHILAVEDLTTVTEYFVIATGMSTTHVGALADEAEFQLDREGVKVLRTEGHDGKRWVLLDYGSVIVHVFTQEAHDYYDLEHLWADATVVPASEWMPEQPEDEQ